jgi:hypothetical protein
VRSTNYINFTLSRWPWPCQEKNRKNVGPRGTTWRGFVITGGGKTHMTQSLATVNSYALPGEDPPDFKGAIGVNNDSVEGTDITIPVYNFKETHYIPIALVTPAYKAALFYLTGKVNDAPFKGFARGEVLFLGASGSQQGTEDWEIAFKFAASPNATDLTVGDITGIEKKG